MKVLDLQCRHGHVFEGWFGSEDDFQSQRERGLVQCPMCADSHIEKRLSAPRLNLGASAPAPAPAAARTEAALARRPEHGQASRAVEAGMLPPALQNSALHGGDAPETRAPIRPLAEVEREAIESAIAACGGNIPRAAVMLGISPSTIYRKKMGWEEPGNGHSH